MLIGMTDCPSGHVCMTNCPSGHVNMADCSSGHVGKSDFPSGHFGMSSYHSEHVGMTDIFLNALVIFLSTLSYWIYFPLFLEVPFHRARSHTRFLYRFFRLCQG